MYNAGSVMYYGRLVTKYVVQTVVLLADSWSRATYVKMTVADVVKKF
jgi:hypothetical protein